MRAGCFSFKHDVEVEAEQMHFVVVFLLLFLLLLHLVSVTVGSRSTTKKETAPVAYWLVLRTGDRTVVVSNPVSHVGMFSPHRLLPTARSATGPSWKAGTD